MPKTQLVLTIDNGTGHPAVLDICGVTRKAIKGNPGRRVLALVSPF